MKTSKDNQIFALIRNSKGTPSAVLLAKFKNTPLTKETLVQYKNINLICYLINKSTLDEATTAFDASDLIKYLLLQAKKMGVLEEFLDSGQRPLLKTIKIIQSNATGKQKMAINATLQFIANNVDEQLKKKITDKYKVDLPSVSNVALTESPQAFSNLKSLSMQHRAELSSSPPDSKVANKLLYNGVAVIISAATNIACNANKISKKFYNVDLTKLAGVPTLSSWLYGGIKLAAGIVQLCTTDNSIAIKMLFMSNVLTDIDTIPKLAALVGLQESATITINNSWQSILYYANQASLCYSNIKKVYNYKLAQKIASAIGVKKVSTLLDDYAGSIDHMPGTLLGTKLTSSSISAIAKFSTSLDICKIIVSVIGQAIKSGAEYSSKHGYCSGNTEIMVGTLGETLISAGNIASITSKIIITTALISEAPVAALAIGALAASDAMQFTTKLLITDNAYTMQFWNHYIYPTLNDFIDYGYNFINTCMPTELHDSTLHSDNLYPSDL